MVYKYSGNPMELLLYVFWAMGTFLGGPFWYMLVGPWWALVYELIWNLMMYMTVTKHDPNKI